MVEDEKLTDHVRIMEENLTEQIEKLGEVIDERFERMKKIITDYLTLGSDFVKGSLITALKQV